MENPYIASKNSKMKKPITKAFYSKSNILKYSQTLNLSIDSCQHMNKKYKLLTITFNIFSLLQNLMLPLPLKYPIWNSIPLKASSIKAGIVKGKSLLCAWHLRTDFFSYMDQSLSLKLPDLLIFNMPWSLCSLIAYVIKNY